MQTRSLWTKWSALSIVILISATISAAKAGDVCWGPGWGSGSGSGWGGQGGSGGWYTQQSYYYDVRDTRIYSATKYNTPVTIPVAPMVRGYNYGWGVPSARLSPIGGYTAWYPDQPFTMYGGRVPGGLYPTVYQPTDTTQLGYYYQYVPSWQPR
jgi:hypothetical protein